MRSLMRRCKTALLSVTMLAAGICHAQTGSDAAGQEKARALLDQMVQALGGDGWLNRHDWMEQGHYAFFYRGAPTGSVVEFWDYHRVLGGPETEEERIELTKKRDIVQMYIGKSALEITFRGKTDLPEDQAKDYFRRREHSIEVVVKDWLKLPGTMVVSEGSTMVQRRLADKVTVISPTNDAVTIELDANTHLPLARTFQFRNEKYKDFDSDREEYDDYHPVQGLPTAYKIARYRNGDMSSQKFYSEVKYNQNPAPTLFDVEATVAEKKKVKK